MIMRYETLPVTGRLPWERPKRKRYQLGDGTEGDVDAELDPAILDRLNRLPGLEVTSVCAGHQEIPEGRWQTIGGGTRHPHLILWLQATSPEAYAAGNRQRIPQSLRAFHTDVEIGRYHTNYNGGGFITLACRIDRTADNGPALDGWWQWVTDQLERIKPC